MKIDPYTGATSQSTEDQGLLRKIWYFVGLTTFLEKKNDFFLRRVAGEEVIITFDGANISAAINRCPHRGAPFVRAKFGNQDLTCPFHGWCFSHDGKLLAIPYSDAKYQFSPEKKRTIALSTLQVRTVGKFIFVNHDKNPVPIEEQVPPSLLMELEVISKHMDCAYSITHIPAAANWKLLAEIVFDELHVPFVHANTFAKLLKYEPNNKVGVVSSIDDVQSSGSDAGHKDIWASARELSFSIGTQNPNFKAETWHKDVDRYRGEDYYYDFYIFPNLHLISAAGGFAFSYCAYFPDDVDHTTVDYLFTTAKVKTFSHIIPVAHLESIRMGLTVYEEDVAMMEEVQRAVDPNFLPTHGAYESHIRKWRHFFKEYSNV